MNTTRFTSHRLLMSLMTSLFFIWGFITLLNDLLIPNLKALFNLNYTEAMLIQFCFFFTYFIMSPIMAWILARTGYRLGIVLGLLIIAAGCLLFLPASSLRLYPLFLFALFVLASGIVLLQVSANPAVSLLGSDATGASRLTFAQAINALGYTIAPMIVGGLIVSNSIRGPYTIMAIILALVAVCFLFTSFQSIEKPRVETFAKAHTLKLWKQPTILLGILAIFLYVGAEVSAGSLIVNYLHLPSIGNLTLTAAAGYLSFYWGGSMVGRFLGTAIMLKISPRKAVAFNAFVAIILVLITILGHGYLAMWCLLALGLCNSVMFPTIFALVVAALPDNRSQKIVSGYLCSAIVGGAILPMIQGWLADQIGLQASFALLLVPYLFIGWYSVRALKPANV